MSANAFARSSARMASGVCGAPRKESISADEMSRPFSARTRAAGKPGVSGSNGTASAAQPATAAGGSAHAATAARSTRKGTVRMP